MDIAARLDADHLAVYKQMPPGMLDLSDIPTARRRLAERMAAPAGAMPTDVRITDEPVTAHDGASLLVRLYAPASPRSSSPALYWIHGGGMVLGDVSMNDLSCAEIAAELDVQVASVDYRLAPEHPFPVPIEDCYSGLKWLFDSVERFDLDAARIAIGGGSAGGGLAAGLALLARDRAEVRPCFQLLTYPMLDDRNITPSSRAIVDDRLWNREANLAGWNAYLDGAAGADDVSIYAAPSRATDLAGLPPACLTVGDLDLFLDEDIAYAQGLLQAGVPTELHVYPGAFHGSSSMIPHAALSKRWKRDELAALDRALNG